MLVGEGRDAGEDSLAGGSEINGYPCSLKGVENNENKKLKLHRSSA